VVKCDVCIDRKKSENIFEIKELRKEVLTLLKGKLYTLEQLEKRINPRDSELFVEVIREMVDDGVVEYDSVWRLKINVDQNP
jgi:ATP-dependent DNA helicase RecQ